MCTINNTRLSNEKDKYAALAKWRIYHSNFSGPSPISLDVKYEDNNLQVRSLQIDPVCDVY